MRRWHCGIKDIVSIEIISLHPIHLSWNIKDNLPDSSGGIGSMRVGGIGSSWLHTTGWEGPISSMNAEVTGLGCLHLHHHLAIATGNIIICHILCVVRSIDWVPNSDCAQKVRKVWSKDTRLLHNPIMVFEPLIDVKPHFADQQWHQNDIHYRIPSHCKLLCQYPKNL